MTTSHKHVSNEDLLAYLEERLDVADSSRLEEELLRSPETRVRAAELLDHASATSQSAGAVWARHGISCPDRTSWSGYLLGLVEDAELECYARFHLEIVGCRRCRANLEELQAALEGDAAAQSRQQRIFESSVGRLRSFPLQSLDHNGEFRE